jgi:hypothetical protein
VNTLVPDNQCPDPDSRWARDALEEEIAVASEACGTERTDVHEIELASPIGAVGCAHLIGQARSAIGATRIPVRDVDSREIGSDSHLVHQAARSMSGRWRIQQVRRRVLNLQLDRLACRAGDDNPAARDAAGRTVRLIARLERNDLDW